MRPARSLLLTVNLLLLMAGGSAYGVDYVSVGQPDSIQFDAPSLKAKKIFVVSRHMPLEQVIALDNWVKVRDSSGGLAWMERRALSSKRYVLVTAPQTSLLAKPDESSPVLARVGQQVVLEWLESTGSGWVKVRHEQGAQGYVRSADVWGN